MNCEKCNSEMNLVENSLEHKIYECTNAGCKNELKVKIHRHFRRRQTFWQSLIYGDDKRATNVWYRHPFVIIPSLFIFSALGVLLVYLFGQMINALTSGF